MSSIDSPLWVFNQCAMPHIFSQMKINTGTSTTKIADNNLKIGGIVSHCGCSCSMHSKCGVIVNEGTILHLTLVYVAVGVVKEKEVAAVEVEGCCVGFT